MYSLRASTASLRYRARSSHWCIARGVASGGSIEDPGSKVLPTSTLIKDAIFFELCRSPLLIRLLTKSMDYSFARELLKPVFRAVVFPKFCAGETFEECKTTVEKLYQTHKITSIIDESCEEFHDDASFEAACRGKLVLLERIGRELNGKVSFVPLKCTSLLPPTSLEALTSYLVQENLEPPPRKSSMSYEDHVKLIERDAALAKGLNRLRTICSSAQSHQISLLLDAEQTHRQPAIDVLYRILAYEFNHEAAVLYNTYQCYLQRAQRALHLDHFFLTRQHPRCFAVKLVRGAYLLSERERWQEACAKVQKASAGLASPSALPANPLLPDKESVDRNYDQIARYLLDEACLSLLDDDEADREDLQDTAKDDARRSSTVSNQSLPPVPGVESEAMSLRRVSVLFATHNRTSVESLAREYEARLRRHQNNTKARGDRGLKASSPSTTSSNTSSNALQVHFAQILGMSDLVTFQLAHRHFNGDVKSNSSIVTDSTGSNASAARASKLLLYGSIDELMPWLLRRLHENQDAFGAMQQELTLYRQLLRRRLFAR